ncbi:hypothetical protein RBB80_27490 [Tunturiibacter gelidiferens]
MDVGAGGGGGTHVGGSADLVEDGLGEAVDGEEVGAHALGHDLRSDVDHVGVTHAPAVDNVGHLHTAVELVGLDLDREDADLRGLHIFEDCGGEVGKGRGARASRTKALQVQPMRSSSATREAAMVRQRSSVMSVTFSLGWMRRQVVTALRAPAVNSGGNAVVRRSGAVGVA